MKIKYIVAGLVFFSCSNRSDIRFELLRDRNQNLFFENYVERSVSVIPITGNDTLMMGSVAKAVSLADSLWIFHDYIQNALVKTTTEGKIVDIFRRTGRGPGEYTRLYDFDVDVLNRHLLLLCDPTSIVITDFDFNVKRVVKLNDYYERIAFYEGELYLFCNNRWAVDRLDKNFNPTQFLKSKRPNNGLPFSGEPVFYATEAGLLIKMDSDDSIFKIENGVAAPFFTLNWRDKESNYRFISSGGIDAFLQNPDKAPPVIKRLIVEGRKLIVVYSKFLFYMAMADLDTGEILADGVILNSIENSPPSVDIRGDLTAFFFPHDTLANRHFYNDIDFRAGDGKDGMLVRYKLRR